MTAPRALPVLMPTIPGQRWSCHSCGNCCRSLVGHLYEEERARLDEQGWAETLGVAPYVRLGRGTVLNKQADGACVFLTENNRCRIHEKFGEAAKPLACRIFPFSVRPVNRGWQASFRFDCPSAASSQGVNIAQHRVALTEIVSGMDHRAPRGDDTADLQRGLRASTKEIELIVSRMTRLVQDRRLPLHDRIVSAARVTAALERASLIKVREQRLGELIDLLLLEQASASAQPDTPPNERQLGLFRQLVFAHAEHLSLAEMRAGALARLGRRARQLRNARRFLRGQGVVPDLPGIPGAASFGDVERLSTVTQGSDEADDLLTRYLIARLSGRSVFGSGYYGWPVFMGLNGLWLSVAVIGWLTRRHALARSHAPNFSDVAEAVGIVDRAATRLPSLGTVAERTRINYLAVNDGIPALIRRFFPTQEGSPTATA